MTIFPKAKYTVQTEPEYAVSGGKSFAFDFTAGEFRVKDGKVQTVSGKERLQVQIEKLIRTERGVYGVYDGTTYGLYSPYAAIGTKNRDYVTTDLKEELRTKLEAFSEILSVQEITVDFINRGVTITLTVVTSFDEEAMKIVYED